MPVALVQPMIISRDEGKSRAAIIKLLKNVPNPKGVEVERHKYIVATLAEDPELEYGKLKNEGLKEILGGADNLKELKELERVLQSANIRRCITILTR